MLEKLRERFENNANDFDSAMYDTLKYVEELEDKLSEYEKAEKVETVIMQEPTNFKELRDALNFADQRELKDYDDYATEGLEDRVILLENRLLIVGVCLSKALKLLTEKDAKSIN